jgi:hypothetical protein
MEKSIRKILVIGLSFLFLGAGAMVGVSASFTNGQTGVIQHTYQTISKNVVGQTGVLGNVKISTNPDNDYHPKITVNSKGVIVVMYEEELGLLEKVLPMVYSTDKGQTWTRAATVNSVDLQGSGILQYPHITYNANLDMFWFTAIDPNADQYNSEMSMIPGDIANAAAIDIRGISGTSSTGYYWNAAACTNNFFLSLTSEDYSPYEKILGLGWWTYPDYAYPPGLGGFYYDGQSLFAPAPVAELEADQSSARVFFVFESDQGKNNFVGIKSGTADETLITSGEQQNAMDKYGDVEQMPAMWVTPETMDSSDPDVAASGTNVCVVYTQGGDVKCSHSTCTAVYDPGFNFAVSTVETGASTPAVYMSGSTVSCAYVKGGNLYYKVSTGTATQMNDVNGKVIAAKGAVDIGKLGIVFQDNRDGKSHIYIAAIAASEPDAPTITGPSGDAKTAYDYKVVTTDPQGDQVSYYIDWGDSTNTGWIGPFASGAEQTQSHTFSAKGNYTIKAKAKDVAGHESDWGTLTVSMPYKFNPFQQLIEKLFERFPNAFPVLRQLLGY